MGHFDNASGVGRIFGKIILYEFITEKDRKYFCSHAAHFLRICNHPQHRWALGWRGYRNYSINYTWQKISHSIGGGKSFGGCGWDTLFWDLWMGEMKFSLQVKPSIIIFIFIIVSWHTKLTSLLVIPTHNSICWEKTPSKTPNSRPTQYSLRNIMYKN